MDTVFTIIVALSVLWNISIDRREDDVPGPEPDEIDNAHLPPGHHDAVAGRLRRDQIVEDHFTR